MSQAETEISEPLAPDQVVQLIHATIQRADEIKLNLNQIIQTGSERVEQLQSILPAEKVQSAIEVLEEGKNGNIQQSLDEVHEVGVKTIYEIQKNQETEPQQDSSSNVAAAAQAEELQRNVDIVGEAARKKMNEIATTINADIEEARKLMAEGQQRS